MMIEESVTGDTNVIDQSLRTGSNAPDAAIERIEHSEATEPCEYASGDAAARIGCDGVKVQSLDMAGSQEVMVIDRPQDGAVTIS